MTNIAAAYAEEKTSLGNAGKSILVSFVTKSARACKAKERITKKKVVGNDNRMR